MTVRLQLHQLQLQLPCTGDPPHTSSTDYGPRTDAGM